MLPLWTEETTRCSGSANIPAKGRCELVLFTCFFFWLQVTESLQSSSKIKGDDGDGGGGGGVFMKTTCREAAILKTGSAGEQITLVLLTLN